MSEPGPSSSCVSVDHRFSGGYCVHCGVSELTTLRTQAESLRRERDTNDAEFTKMARELHAYQSGVVEAVKALEVCHHNAIKEALSILSPLVTPNEKQRPAWYDEYKNEPSTDSEPSQWRRSHNPYNGP